MGEFETVMQPSTSSRVCITVKNSPNPSSVYIRLCKQRKKVFYCCYKITFPRKNKNSLFRLLIKREILTSREVLYTKLNVRVISSCFAIRCFPKKGLSRLKCHLKRKKIDSIFNFAKIFQVSSDQRMGK